MVYAAALPSDCLRLFYHHLPLRSFARCLATCRGWNLNDEVSDPLWLAVAHVTQRDRDGTPMMAPAAAPWLVPLSVRRRRGGRAAPAERHGQGQVATARDAAAGRPAAASKAGGRAVPPEERGEGQAARFGVEGGGPDLGGNPGQRGEEQERSMGSSSSGWRSRRSERSERSRRRERSRRSESSERSGKSERSGRSRGATGWERVILVVRKAAAILGGVPSPKRGVDQRSEATGGL